MSVIHAPRKPDLDARLLAFPLVTFGLFSVLAARLWYFQIVKSQELVERAESSRIRAMSRPAPRGIIEDRNGMTIAGVRPQLLVTAVFDVVNKPENKWVITKLAALLGADEKKLWQEVNEAKRNRNQAMPIYLGATPEVSAKIVEAGSDLPGIDIDTVPMRSYSDPFSYTHLLGYVGLPTDRDLERLKTKGIEKPAEFVGKGGVEQAFEAELMGSPGEDRTEMDAKGRAVRQIGHDNPVPGNRLVLSLDGRLQRFTTQIMKERGYIGGVVAIEPKTGEVLTLVSSPTYDLSKFLGGIKQKDWDTIDNDPKKPMMKRPMRSAYSPGSTFKIVTTLAAVRRGIFDPNRPYTCRGGYQLGKRFLKCLGHHGAITFERAMAKSCNSYFCDLGYRAGPDALNAAAKEFGLGQQSGLDIGGDSAGVVPDQEWIEKIHGHWYGGNTLNLSIGQGEISTTPLQMANLIAMVANDGVGYRPHVVKAIRRSDDGSMQPVLPDVLHRIDAPAAYWTEVKTALRQVVANGTAGAANLPGISVAGKTGSTEHGKGKKTHAWFVGYAPAEDPKIAICVLLEASGHGGEVAVPVAAEVIKKYMALTTKPAPR